MCSRPVIYEAEAGDQLAGGSRQPCSALIELRVIWLRRH
jgi:hypothetical protein